MDTETALRDLGVGEDTLSPAENRALDEQGRQHLRPDTSQHLTPQMRHLLDV